MKDITEEMLINLNKKKVLIGERKNAIIKAKSEAEFIEKRNSEYVEELATLGVENPTKERIEAFLSEIETEVETLSKEITDLFEDLKNV